MESTINAMIPYAIKCIGDNPNIKAGGVVNGIYESYLSQFGPMAIQLGLRSTLAVYQNKEGGSKGKRFFILDLMHSLLKESGMMDLTQHPLNSREKWINAYLKETNEINQKDEQLILDSSVALKRAIRTFSLTDDKTE